MESSSVEVPQNETMQTPPPVSKSKKSRRLFVTFAIVVVVLIAVLGTVAAGTWLIYVKHSDGKIIRSLANHFPIPAARVGSRTIYYRDFLRTRDTLKTFLASPAAKSQNLNVPFDQNLEKNILEKLINQTALEELAEQKHISVSDEQLRQYFAQVVAAASSTTPDVGVYLLQNFGWNEEDFRQQVLKESLLEQQVGDEMTKENGGNPQALTSYLEKRLQQPDVVRYLRF